MKCVRISGYHINKGERQPLIDLRKKIEKGGPLDSIPLFATEEALGKGRREKVKRYSADVGETPLMDMEPRPVGVLEELSVPSPQPSRSSDMAEEIEELKNEIKALKEDLKYEQRIRIKAERELREWKEMHAVVQELKCTVGEIRKMCSSKQKPDSLENSSYSEDIASQSQEPCTAQGSGQVIDYISLGEGVRIKKSQFEKINTRDFKKFTNELFLITFGRETLATHSLNGRKAPNAETSKEALPAHKVSVLMEYIQKKFNVSKCDVKAVIRAKLNNEDKLFRRRNLHEQCGKK
ncbi:BEN domain-containing protein 6 [Spea bombifrons]|uniref:BEN domain-containing protein 6 n=1 Tax=Spea bombifrons TaxID=233779 RepID=UPI00234B896A|nr:BEN domain-containing protein 6 [Spea bombifrons]